MSHSKVAGDSVEVNSNRAALWFDVAFGVNVSVVSGGVVSMSHCSSAGVRSTFPAASVARTRRVWVLSLREGVV